MMSLHLVRLIPATGFSLFINGKKHAKATTDSKKEGWVPEPAKYEAYEKWENYDWKRPADVFEGIEYVLYDQIEPEDVK